VHPEIVNAMKRQVVGVVCAGGIPSRSGDEDDIAAGKLPIDILKTIVNEVRVSQDNVFGTPT
jgi:hypothetical protein